MHVGIFGGSFNPPHVAHLIVAETMRDAFALDRVLWIPSARPPHKPTDDLAPAEDRFEMACLAVDGYDVFTVSRIELDRDGPSYTVETVRRLQEDHPETVYSLIVGGDSLRDFDRWYRPQEIARRVPLLVYRRPGMPAPDVPSYLSGRVRFADAPLIEVSSTLVRERLRAGRSIRFLVPEAVADYIAREHLYGVG